MLRPRASNIGTTGSSRYPKRRVGENLCSASEASRRAGPGIWGGNRTAPGCRGRLRHVLRRDRQIGRLQESCRDRALARSGFDMPNEWFLYKRVQARLLALQVFHLDVDDWLPWFNGRWVSEYRRNLAQMVAEAGETPFIVVSQLLDFPQDMLEQLRASFRTSLRNYRCSMPDGGVFYGVPISCRCKGKWSKTFQMPDSSTSTRQ